MNEHGVKQGPDIRYLWRAICIKRNLLDLMSLSFGLLTLKMASKVHNEHNEQCILEFCRKI